MRRKFTGPLQGRAFCSILVAVWVSSLSVHVVLAQTGNPAFEAKVDSIKQIYLNIGIPEPSAEQRARDRVQGEYDFSRQVVPRGGTGPTAFSGSIAVNRDPKYVAFTPIQLVDSVFVRSSVCSSVSNVMLKAHGWDGTAWTNVDGTNRGLGYYNRTNTVSPGVFEFAEGLVLATGGLRAIEGPNMDVGNGGNKIPDPIGAALGDPDLALLEPGITNVSVLEFDFVPASSLMTFRYIFASEEYLEYANSGYNDVFGFFISGPGITGGNIFGNLNIATLPIAGNPYVAINNINWGYTATGSHNSASPAGFVGPAGVYSQAPQNPSFYINIPGAFSAPMPAVGTRDDSLRMSIELDGRTIVLTASCLVIPCEQYHLKLAIANTGDQLWQSAVFLEAHSFEIGANVDNYGSMNPRQTILYRGCADNQFAVYRPCSDDIKADTTVYLTYSGTAYLDGNITSNYDLSKLYGLPDSIIIPAGLDTTYVPYSVNTVNAGAGHRTFYIHSEVRNVCGGTYTLPIDLYDTSNPDAFQASATVTCPFTSAGTITVTTNGAGGSGQYECSIDSGATWQEAPRTYTNLPPKDIDVYIRDKGGCFHVTRTVSTRYTAFITPADTADLCPPTYQVVLTTSGSSVATSHEWSRNGVVIANTIPANYTATTTGKYTVRRYNGFCYSEVSDTVLVTMERCLYAFNDTVQTASSTPISIPVLDNDLRSTCPALISAILTPPPSLEGVASITAGNDSIMFTPYPGFSGMSQFVYEIECNGNTHFATVYVRVIEFPDNIIEADCIGDPPATVWDIKELDRSNVFVHAYAQPLVGDFDGCGKNEVLAFNYVTAQTSNALLIFDDQLQLKHTITIPVTYNYLAYPVTIADVDGDGRAEIYVLTGNGATRILQCFGFNGTSWVAKTGYTNASVPVPYNTIAPCPVIADINGDGIPEVFVYDRIVNSRTGAVIATLPAGSRGGYNALNGSYTYYPVLADVDNDGILDIVCGNMVYKAQINNGSTSGTATLTYQAPAGTDIMDGFVSVADIDLDGYLDVIVMHYGSGSSKGYVWSPHKGILLGQTLTGVASTNSAVSRAFIGDVNNDGYPEIAFSYYNGMVCYRWNPLTNSFVQLWRHPTTDSSAMTTMSMFDFNQDGKQEIIYRDETHLRIMDGVTGLNIDSIICYSGTASEMPIVVDLSGEGHAQIIVSGAVTNANPHPNEQALIRRYVSVTPGAWAPARKVWNQHGYNAVNINEDLTVPHFQFNPATVFPNGKRPFNGFLMQQTLLNSFGDLLWTMPDVYFTAPLSVSSDVVGDSVSITVEIANQGDALIGPPVYVSLYKETSPQIYTAGNRIVVDSAIVQLMPGDTAQVTIHIPDITAFLPFANIVIRLNDNGGATFPYRPECDSLNNEITILNPALHLMMKKHATLHMIPTNLVVHDGFYSNPIATLYQDTIEYRIEAVNPLLTTQNVIIRDTIPAYLDYIANSSNYPVTPVTVGLRTALSWTISTSSMNTAIVTFRAEPQFGVNASQPLFVNRAWVTVNGYFNDVPTNFTYHQGAGVSYVTFSAGYGGNIYQAIEQVLDYYTSPQAGIVIVPDKGYRFAGWSHADYLSLRNETILAQSGIMHYDTLTVYGSVELHAEFELEHYPIIYHLDGGYFSDSPVSPASYNIESPDITLVAPEKEGDVFLGWTGSNGVEPCLTVSIPAGSTGERVYYANFLHSERKRDLQPTDKPETDLIWVAEHELYVRVSNPGSILRIYSENGILQKQQVILQPGETKYKLPNGFYIVTLNNSIGQKIMINN